jgi:hypothetical protein
MSIDKILLNMGKNVKDEKIEAIIEKKKKEWEAKEELGRQHFENLKKKYGDSILKHSSNGWWIYNPDGKKEYVTVMRGWSFGNAELIFKKIVC